MNRREYLQLMTGAAGAACFAGQALAQGAAEPPKAIPTITPPDPNPNTPKFKLPPKSCDTHTHIFGPGSKYPYSPTRPYNTADQPLEAFKAVHDKIGVERCVIVNATVHGTDNRVVTDAIAQSNGAYKGVGNVSDDMSDKELEALSKGGITACRFAFLKRLGGVGDMKKFDRIVHRVAELGWHIDVYFEPGTIPDFAPILTKLPAPYVIDHMGTVLAAKGLNDAGFTSLLDLQKRDEKCWVKITGLERASAGVKPFHDAVPFARALIDTAPDRVIWGTDWPHPNVKIMPNDGDIVDLIPLFAPDKAVQQKLLVDNPAKLFKFA